MNEPGLRPLKKGNVSVGHCRISMVNGVRASIAWLHARANEMNDPHAISILNSAAFSLGNDLSRSRLPFQASEGRGSPNP